MDTPARLVPQYADHMTPLVRNCWYVAALSTEVGRTPLARTLVGTRVVLFRKLDGSIAALQDRCRHRSFPLSKGRLENDTLICGYHGMTYDSDGRCTLVPALPSTPGNIRIDSYAVVEHAPLVWIWLGDPAKADPADIPDTSWLGDAGWTTVCGQFHMQTNYVAMHENLLDQTHFTFLHAGSVGTPEWANAPLDVQDTGDGVAIRRELKDSPAPGIYAVPMQLGERAVDRLSEAAFVSPALHVARATITDRSAGVPREFHINISHIFTPETQNTIHYWWFNSRDFGHDDMEASRFLQEASTQAYTEDVDALAWITETVTTDTPGFREMSFRTDRPGLMMRQSISRRVEQEIGAAAA